MCKSSPFEGAGRAAALTERGSDFSSLGDAMSIFITLIAAKIVEKF
jgi:hypothetical protein